MLIDSFAPQFDADETHTILIHASRQMVYEAVRTADIGGSASIKFLLLLRSLPAFVTRRQDLPRNQKITLETMMSSGFGLLADEPPNEIVLGVTGRFWRPAGNLSPFHRKDFDRPVPAGLARGVWNFSISEGGNGKTILRTETRVICGDVASRRKFLTYWLIVRPFSGLIRQIILKRVRSAAEAGLGLSYNPPTPGN